MGYAVMTVFLALLPVFPGGPEPLRRGMAARGCVYLEVTGPAAARALILKRAKEQYREPDPELLATAAARVIVRVGTAGTAPCTRYVPAELIFVDKKTDTPALRLPLDADTTVIQNGFGATWSSTDGVAIVELARFRQVLGVGKFKVLAVMKSGETTEIKAGLGTVAWSGEQTEQVVGP